MKEIFIGNSKEGLEQATRWLPCSRKLRMRNASKTEPASLLAVFVVGYGHHETTVNAAKKMRQCGESFLKF